MLQLSYSCIPHLVFHFTQQFLLLLTLGTVHLHYHLLFEVLSIVYVRVYAKIFLGHVTMCPVDRLRFSVVGYRRFGLQFGIQYIGQRLFRKAATNISIFHILIRIELID